MYLEQRRQAMLQLHLSDRQFNWLQSVSNIRDFTVLIVYKKGIQSAGEGMLEMPEF